MEDGMKKFALIAILVVIAVVLVTCDLLVPEAIEEWTDVEYEIEGRVGQERVKSIKLYFQPDGMDRSVLPGPNTYGVLVSPQQRAIIRTMRALSADNAAASHDFFEAVFVGGTATTGGITTCTNVVRTTWEIGYPAGISGSLLANATGYDNLFLGTAASRASTVFVGRKTNKTLLGVGQMTLVDDGVGTNGVKTATTTSVTFTVAPIRTWVGMYDNSGTYVLRGKATNWYGGGEDQDSGNATFTTSLTATAPTYTTTGVAGITREPFTPVKGQPNQVFYPLYARPKNPNTSPNNAFNALYTIGGIVDIPSSSAPQPSVLPAIRVFGSWAVVATPTQDANGQWTAVRGGMQVIKRKPAYLFNGRTYQAGSVYDSFTQLTSGNVPNVGISGTSVNLAHAAAFVNAIPIGFSITNQSSGIFALTFQCPVYAITTEYALSAVAGSTRDDKNRFTKWFIRPADGPDLYLLDSGFDEGGMVMLGDTDSLSDDWIEIKTLGIGFQNN